jgi:hypothetical protein
MNAKRRVVSLCFAMAMMGALPMLANASTTVVTHWAPGTVTTVHTYGPYWGAQPVACCSYGGAVAAGVAAGVVTGAAIASASAPKPAVVYTPPPPVVTLPVIYVTPPPVHYYYVP